MNVLLSINLLIAPSIGALISPSNYFKLKESSKDKGIPRKPETTLDICNLELKCN